MQKRLAEVVEYLNVSRDRLLASVTSVHPSFAVIRPRSGAWSAAEILDHLAIVEGVAAKLIARSILWGRENGIGPETSDESLLSTLDRFSIVEATRPLAAPERLNPPRDSSLDEALKSLTASRQALRDALMQGDGMDLSVITRPHPVFGELNIYQWGIFVGQHEERHSRQIEQTLRELRESAAESVPIF